MMPFVGKDYKNGLLIIGESHYLDERTPKSIIKKWNDYSLEDLQKDLDNYKTVMKINEELKYNLLSWTNTSGLIDEGDSFVGGHAIFGNIDKAIQEITKIEQFECWSKIAFMNFFQRPAYNEGDSIDPTEKDWKIANETLDFVVEIIKPKYIYFVSRKSWEELSEELFDKMTSNDIIINYGPHPACYWWNKESKKYQIKFHGRWKRNLTGKMKFKYFLKENEIFE